MKRNNIIDFLRFTAILLVVLSHCQLNNTPEYIKRLLSPGYLGVELFFVLSGFLVSGLILNEYKQHASFNAKLFLIRRGFKIYPPYYIFLIGASIYQLFKNRFSLQGFFSDFFFLSNYTEYSSRTWFWSLSLEEHFYLFLCLVFFLLAYLNKVNFRSIFAIYIALLLISIVCRIYYYNYFAESWKRDYQMTHSRLDSLFFGVVIYFCYLNKNKFYLFIMRNEKMLLILSTTFILSNYIFLRDYRLLNMFYLSANSVAFGMIITIVLNKVSLNDNFFIKKFAVIGRYSYSIYLIHPALGVISPRLHIVIKNDFLYALAYITLCFLSGTILSKIIEMPFLKLLDRLFSSRSKVAIS